MILVCLSGIYLMLSGLNNSIVFFYPPSEINKIQLNYNKVRVGWIIKLGSIIKQKNEKIRFIITDHMVDLTIEYSGLLPAMFKEKQGVIAEGKLVNPSLFKATKLLIKHDENYSPPELSKT